MFLLGREGERPRNWGSLPATNVILNLDMEFRGKILIRNFAREFYSLALR